MLAQTTLIRVRETARIDEVAATYMTLRRSGKDFVALCPFHDERHPSFRISTALNIGKCFSCGEAADPIGLVRHMEGCGFEEAVRLLARRYGIEVEEDGPDSQRRRDKREAILLANDAFARSLLPSYPTIGEGCPEKDLTRLLEAYKRFGAGMCPENVPRGYQRFLGRLVFPVRTTGGQVAGFAGRWIGSWDGKGEEPKKYVNSLTSVAYRKGSILYGLHEAVKAVRDEGRILLCEGYKDVIAFHASGIRYAVGLCGTALTPEHIRQIRRLTLHVTLALDPDGAGQASALRSARLLLAEGCEVSLIELPDGMDPDEVFRREGADTLARLAREGATDFLSSRIREVASGTGGTGEAIREVLADIRLLASPLAMYQRIEELSRATGIPGEVLRQELSALSAPQGTPGIGETPPYPASRTAPEGLSAGERREKALLRFCLAYHDRMLYDDEGGGISLPAWISEELTANDMPMTHPDHARLLRLLSDGGHPDGVTDEALSALILSLRSYFPEDGEREAIPDERLPDEAQRLLLLYAEPFVHRRLANAIDRLRAATSPEERLSLLADLADCFALSDRIGRELKSQSIIPWDT